jgi:hypothetical protein
MRGERRHRNKEMREKGGKESEGVKDRSKEGGKGRIIKRKGRKR